MVRLPIPHGDSGSWGTILNDYLSVSHHVNGTLITSAVKDSGAEMVTDKNQANGYAGLDGSGLISTDQLPDSANVAAYLGLESSGMSIESGAESIATVAFTGTTAQLGSDSISWDSSTPERVSVLQTGVYSITAGVYWRDAGGTGPISAQILSSCEFNVCDIRPAVGDGVTESQQFITVALYLQTGQSFELNISQSIGSTLSPYIQLLVTRCA